MAHDIRDGVILSGAALPSERRFSDGDTLTGMGAALAAPKNSKQKAAFSR